MKTPYPILLDTNHLSDIAREPGKPACVEVLRRLRDGQATLVVTLFHLIELSDPAFTSVGELTALLRATPHLLANPFEDVEEEEIASACARASGLRRRPPRVFAPDTSEWGSHGGPVGGSAVDMLEVFRVVTSPRDEVVAMAAWGASASMLKDRATLVREPTLPLQLAVTRHLEMHRRTFSAYAAGLTAAEVIERAGGPEFFAGYHVQESLTKQRMLTSGQKSTANDVFDELNAFYAPYCAATALDRGTFHRASVARLACVDRMTNDLAAVPGILDLVAAGDSSPLESA